MVKLICLTAAVTLMIFAVGCGPKEESFSEKESTDTQIVIGIVQTQPEETAEDSTATTEGSTSTTEETTAATTDNGNSDDNNNWTQIY